MVMRKNHNIVLFLHGIVNVTSFNPRRSRYSKALSALGKMFSKRPELSDLIDVGELVNHKPYSCFYRMGKDLASMGEISVSREVFFEAFCLAPWEYKIYPKIFSPKRHKIR